MRNNTLLTIALLGSFFLTQGCTKDCDADTEDLTCKEITLNEPFIAKIGETWCRPEESWEVTFGPFIEDSRCNVPDIDCFWEGRYVMASLFDNGEVTKDTFYAVTNWRDTLVHDQFTIILNKVYPELRADFEPLDPDKYSFEVIVK